MGGKILMMIAAWSRPFPRWPGRTVPAAFTPKPIESDTGLVTGTVKGAVLTHAIAVERDRTRVYLATLDAAGTGFRFRKTAGGPLRSGARHQGQPGDRRNRSGAAADLPEDRARNTSNKA